MRYCWRLTQIHYLTVKIRTRLYGRVRPYLSLQRLCFKCQTYGHVWKYCRSREFIWVICGLASHEGAECTWPPTCANCEGLHPADARVCDGYNLEKEVITINVKERVPFREAKERAMALYVRPGVPFTAVLAQTTWRPGLSESQARGQHNNSIAEAPRHSLERIEADYSTPPPRGNKRREVLPPEQSQLTQSKVEQSGKRRKPLWP